MIWIRLLEAQGYSVIDPVNIYLSPVAPLATGRIAPRQRLYDLGAFGDHVRYLGQRAASARNGWR